MRVKDKGNELEEKKATTDLGGGVVLDGSYRREQQILEV